MFYIMTNQQTQQTQQTQIMQQTVLHDMHLKLGAKMVNFGGWHMPIQYQSQIEEHLAVRNAIGMFDVSHMCIVDVKGPQVKEFLSYILANNIDKLRYYGKALYSCMLNEHGGIIDDLIVYYLQDNYYRLVVNAGCADKDIAWLNKQNIDNNFDIVIQIRRDVALIAVQGPQALSLFPEEIQNLKIFHAYQYSYKDTIVARTGYTGEDGVEIMLPAHQAEQTWLDFIEKGAKPCGLGARDTLRLEAGMNLYGQDMNENTLPYDVGLAWTLSLFDDRNFIGKEALMNNQQTMQFLGLVLQDGAGILRAHQKIYTQIDGVEYGGEITSGGYSPSMQKSIAMAQLPMQVKLNSFVDVDIRGKRVPAKVIELPFVRHGKIIHQI
jgi:aminomethyltransferase